MTVLQKLEKQPSALTRRSEKNASLCSAPVLRVRRKVCHRCLEHVGVRRGLGACAEVLNEATVVEGAALSAGGGKGMYWAVRRGGLRSHERESRLCYRGKRRGRASAARRRRPVGGARRRCGLTARDRSRRAMRRGEGRDVDATVERAWANAEPAMPAPTMMTSYDEPCAITEVI